MSNEMKKLETHKLQLNESVNIVEQFTASTSKIRTLVEVRIKEKIDDILRKNDSLQHI